MRGTGRTDVAIVGSGPAGAMTGLLLARHGLDVLLLDRETFPRPKPCGDCLSAAATGLLRDAGILDRVLDAGADTLDRWDIAALDGTIATGRLDGHPALALERSRLDAALLDAAREAGARVRQAHVVGLVDDDDGRVVGLRCRSAADMDRVGARLVVGADGLRSVVARRLGLVRRPPRLRKLSLTAHLPGPPDELRHGEMHRVPGGCIGYAPAGHRRCNLTLVVDTDAAGDLSRDGPAAFFRQRVLDRVRALRALNGTPRPALVEVVEHAGAELDRLQDDDLHASGPFDMPVRTSVAPGVALVGDAAGYYDPFTGQGIYRALAGARLLARAVGDAMAAPGAGPGAIDRALRGYARSHHRLTAPTRRIQKGIEWVLRRPALGTRALASLARAPAAMDRLVEVTGDLRHPAALLSPAVLSSLVIPPSWRFE